MTFEAEFASGVRAILTVSMEGCHCDWKPDIPRNLPIGDRNVLLQSYRVWRDECLGKFAERNNLVVRTLTHAGVTCFFFSEKG